MLEKEFKSLISRKKYEQIDMLWDWETSVPHTNFYYIDEKNSLKKRGINVRVRKSSEKIMLQIKTPINSEKALHVSNEAEEEIYEVPLIIKSEKLEKYLSFNSGDIYMIGQLKTHRKEFNWDKDTIVCLDKSFYLGTIDYEIEIEFSNNKINPRLINELENYDIYFNKSTSGKRSRFIKRLKEIIIDN